MGGFGGSANDDDEDDEVDGFFATGEEREDAVARLSMDRLVRLEGAMMVICVQEICAGCVVSVAAAIILLFRKIMTTWSNVFDLVRAWIT